MYYSSPILFFSTRQNLLLQICSKTPTMLRQISFSPFKYRRFFPNARTHLSEKYLPKSCASYRYLSNLNVQLFELPKWENQFRRVYSSHIPNEDPKEFINPEKVTLFLRFKNLSRISSVNFVLLFLQVQNRIWTIPNLLCCARISASPLLCYYILNSDYNVAVGILFVAGFSDLVS